MGRNTGFFAALCLGGLMALASGCASKPRVATNEAKWLTDLPAAQAQAKAEGKIVFMDFEGSDWCPGCILLHREIFPTAKFQEYARANLVLVDVDFPQNKDLPPELKKANDALSEKYKVDGVPTMLLLSADGKELGRLEYMPGEKPEELISQVEKAKRTP